jgi:hypothetical protein
MNKKLKVLNAALLISSVGVLSAMEDVSTKEGLLARIGTLVDAYIAAQHIEVDQHHLAAIAVQPHHTLLAGTDTDMVIKGIRAGNMEEYFLHVKNKAKAKIDAFVDSLMPGNGDFLNGEVKVGGYNQPADRTRDAFKAAVNICIDSTHLATVVPANAQLSSLARFEAAVQDEIINALQAYLDGLSAFNTYSQFLNGEVMLGGPNQPTDRTLFEFLNSLRVAIFN